MDTAYHVDPDIAAAVMLPGNFYRDDTSFQVARERVFARTWQWLGDTADVALPESVSPRELLPGSLDEPVLLVRDASGTLRCLSNVCTHRANLLITVPGRAKDIRCGYHGRRFALDGQLREAPGFEGAPAFPCASDDLPLVPLGLLGPHAFAALDPAAPFEAFFGELQQRLNGLPLGRSRHDPARDRDYHVAAHWALYIENALETLHLPFVHGDTAPAQDSRSIELLRYGCLQRVLAQGDEAVFDSPLLDGDTDSPIAAYECWVFPNLLLRIHPWGLLLSLVLPLAPDRTRIACRAYVWDERKRRQGAPQALDQLEMDNEALIEQVQRGVQSRVFRRGRYAPQHERGVHHFHRLLCEFMGEPPARP